MPQEPKAKNQRQFKSLFVPSLSCRRGGAQRQELWRGRTCEDASPTPARNGFELPGWGWQVDHGATTLWENWNGKDSQNNIMFGDISAWMYQYLGGIRPLKETPGSAMIMPLGVFVQLVPRGEIHFSTVVAAEVGVFASVMAMLYWLLRKFGQ